MIDGLSHTAMGGAKRSLKHEAEHAPSLPSSHDLNSSGSVRSSSASRVHSTGGSSHDSDKENNTQLNEAEQKQLSELKARDREVRAHEQAHAAVGGIYAGAPSYTYQRGPDGQNYAIGGEVSIDTSPVPGDPEATIQKMRVVKRAALAPANPSSADRQVAQQASAKEVEARTDALQEQTRLAEEEQAQTEARRNEREADDQRLEQVAESRRERVESAYSDSTPRASQRINTIA